MSGTTRSFSLALLLPALALTGCSGLVANLAADALSGEGGAFSSDDDPELVRDAIPFGLKTIESLIGSNPDNEKLLLAAASGFTQYSFAFVQQEADFVEEKDPDRARELRARARRLFARAHTYGWRSLEAREDDFKELWPKDHKAALAELDDKEDAPFLYWTAAPLAAQISLTKTDMALIGRLPEAEALMRRALDLDEAFDAGSIHEFFITYEGARVGAMGGSIDKARQHYDRVLQLSDGKKINPHVVWAEVVAVANQDRKLFDELLDRALAFNVDEAPRFRLVNLIAQRRARWLKAHAGDLFLED